MTDLELGPTGVPWSRFVRILGSFCDMLSIPFRGWCSAEWQLCLFVYSTMVRPIVGL